MADFLQSALPWICVGISVAVACVIIAKRSNRKK